MFKRAGKQVRAISEADKAIAYQWSMAGKEYCARGEEFRQRGEYTLAWENFNLGVERLSSAIARNPTSRAAKCARADVLRRKSATELALRSLESALKSAFLAVLDLNDVLEEVPHATPVLSLRSAALADRAEAELVNGLVDHAFVSLRAAIDDLDLIQNLCPDDVGVFRERAIIWYRHAEICLMVDDVNGALHVLDKAMFNYNVTAAKNPVDADTGAHRAWALLLTGKLLSNADRGIEAITALEGAADGYAAVLAIAPLQTLHMINSSFALILAGQWAYEYGRTEDATRFFRRAVNDANRRLNHDRTDARAWFHRAEALQYLARLEQEAGRYDEMTAAVRGSLDAYSTAIDYDPDDYASFNNRANVRMLEAEVAIDREDVDAAFESLTAAIADLERAIDLEPATEYFKTTRDNVINWRASLHPGTPRTRESA